MTKKCLNLLIIIREFHIWAYKQSTIECKFILIKKKIIKIIDYEAQPSDGYFNRLLKVYPGDCQNSY